MAWKIIDWEKGLGNKKQRYQTAWILFRASLQMLFKGHTRVRVNLLNVPDAMRGDGQRALTPNRFGVSPDGVAD